MGVLLLQPKNRSFMKNNKRLMYIIGVLIFLGINAEAESFNAKQFYLPKKIRHLHTYPYYKCFKKASNKYKVPILLLLSVAKGESNYNPKAVSNKGAIGIMQILWPGTAKDLGFKTKKELFNPCRNIQAGARYLSWLSKRYKGDWYLSLAAYYSGPSRVKKNAVPGYGKKYCNYIYSKLKYIKTHSYSKFYYSEIMAYDDYIIACKLKEYIVSKAPSVGIDINKNALNQYVVTVYATTQNLMDLYQQAITRVTGLPFK